MLKKRLITTFVAAALFAGGAFAQSRDELVGKYTTLAGSEANAKTLVNGLRDGKDFTINGTSFKTPTGKMGYGEVNIALSIAEKELGTARPTTTQLRSTLNEVLAMRADGKGWGQIAQAYGFKLGEVMRSEKAEKHARAERAERHAKQERPEKPERPERPEKPERPGR
jgi:hypothetical protein